ncbi:hypothetical protein LTS18_012179 [Coniosporium uncinatum]|uniref:Uncharacterized protein n=1 Tax=Coniosporium uncinatum TaxID=93489 RepID=A0ACC3D966_9PEZI|nr:hypothetical protein LTS18_012179 [Coniosporium uncinatum]
MRALLSAENLTVLELDLCGTRLTLQQDHGDDDHICGNIAALLPTLRRLSLPLRNICPDVLKCQPYAASLRLSEVLVNLSLSRESPLTTSAAHSTRCGSTGEGLLELEADIQDQAKALAAQMTSPKIVRILTHTLPKIEMRSLDVLTGKLMDLTDEMAWDDDGKTVEEDSDPEPEIDTDDFSTSSDESP